MLGEARPYRDYIAWLQRQDPRGAERFWREALAGFAAPDAAAEERGGRGRGGGGVRRRVTAR